MKQCCFSNGEAPKSTLSMFKTRQKHKVDPSMTTAWPYFRMENFQNRISRIEKEPSCNQPSAHHILKRHFHPLLKKYYHYKNDIFSNTQKRLLFVGTKLMHINKKWMIGYWHIQLFNLICGHVNIIICRSLFVAFVIVMHSEKLIVTFIFFCLLLKHKEKYFHFSYFLRNLLLLSFVIAITHSLNAFAYYFCLIISSFLKTFFYFCFRSEIKKKKKRAEVRIIILIPSVFSTYLCFLSLFRFLNTKEFHECKFSATV